MPVFGSGRASRGSGRGSFATRSRGVPTSVRAARARKGHQRRGAHLFASQGAKKGRRTTYRRGGGHLF
jgi:hypothetical protein